MRRDGLWNPRLCALITAMGHGDTLVLADAGLPVPPGVETIDLLWARGQPRMIPVLAAVLGELVTEHAVVAREAHGNHDLLGTLERALGPGDITRVTHEELKQRTAAATAVVRTGDDTPYANVILRAGVPF